MAAGVIPTQVLPALRTNAERPGVIGEPGVLERGNAGFAAGMSLGESDNVEAEPRRVEEGELVFASEAEAVALIGDTGQAQGAKPVAFGVAELEDGSGPEAGKLDDSDFGIRFGRFRTLRAHGTNFTRRAVMFNRGE